MPHSSRLSLLCGVSLIVLASPALAQSQSGTAATDALSLGTIVLTGPADPTAPANGYSATTTAAGKSATPILTTPQSVSVVTAKQMQDQGATSMGQALGYSAGINAQPYGGGDTRFDSPLVRGFDSSNSQYLNGLALMRSSGAPSYDIYGLERVEVLKGPASVLYGSGSPAGVINMVQKRAQDGDFGEAGIGLGNPKDSQAFFDVNHAFSPRFSARLTGTASDSEGTVDDLTNHRGYLALATKWQIDDATTLQFLASYQKDSPITPAGVPYALIGTGHDRQLRDKYYGDTKDDYSDRKMTNLGFQFDHDFGDGWKLTSNFRYQKFDWNYEGFYVNNALDDGMVSRGASGNDESTSTVNLDTRLAGEVLTGALSHQLMFGADLRRYRDRTDGNFAYADDVDAYHPADGTANVSAPWYYSRDDLTLKQAGIYARDAIGWNGLTLTLAARHDWAEQSGTTWTNYAGTSDAGQSDQATTWQAGLSYLLPNGVAPYLSYATSFDPVVGSDINGDALKPTHGKQWEAGVKWQPAGTSALFSAAVYDLRQTNVSASVTENGITGTKQVGEVDSKGIELQGSGELGHGWSLAASYALTDTDQTKGDDVGKELANAPLHSASLWLDHRFADGTRLAGVTLGGGVRYVGSRYGDNANTYALDAATLFDLGASWQLTQALKAQLNVTNLGDTTYVASCSSFGCYYGEGRTVSARLTYRW